MTAGLRILLVLLLPLSLACAERPKWHQVQPDDSAKAQVRRVAYAMLDACKNGDRTRLEAYFAPKWSLMHEGVDQQQREAAGGFELFDGSFVCQTKISASSETDLEKTLVHVGGQYDRDSLAAAAGEIWFDPYMARLGDGQFLAIISKPGETTPTLLILVFNRSKAGWTVVAAE